MVDLEPEDYLNLIRWFELVFGKKVKSLEDSKTDIGWGHQIRSYVLQPYRLVKDLRNNYENTNPDSVLNGEIDGFLENSLFRSKGKNK